MSELASLVAQLSGSSPQPAADQAALTLARASMDALSLRLGQAIDARVAGQLAAGLTLLSAARESFVLKLETPLPTGTAVTIRVTATTEGPPAVTVSMPNSRPPGAQPLPVPTLSAMLVEAQGAQLPPSNHAPVPSASPPTSSAPAAVPAVGSSAGNTTAQPSAHAAPAAPSVQGELVTVRVLPQVPTQPPRPATPVGAVPTPVATAASRGAGPVQPGLTALPVGQSPPVSATLYPPPVSPIGAAAAMQPRPVVPVVVTTVPSRAPVPPLNLTDPTQAAARQDSVAPLLARLAAIVTAAAPSLPRPLLELAQKVLANRVDLNRAAPDGRTLETALLRSGVLLAPPAGQPSGDSRATLLALRAGLVGLLGGQAAAPVAEVKRPPPPIKGEPPRAPSPRLAQPEPAANGEEDVARALLGQTDAALSRLKLLQAASQPAADARPDAPAPRGELRVEIPLLFGAQTGILQLLVERDGKQKRQQRDRGWRMRFAMNFAETGEVGADIAMLGHAASVSIWAAEPEIADALEALLPELGPAIQRHGLELISLRVRRGTPRPASTTPGQLLDSAR